MATVAETDDDRKEVTGIQDFAKLQHLLEGLVGQPCLRAELSYGNELVIRFGEGLPHKHPALAGVQRGSWELSLVATPWALFPEDKQSMAYIFGLPFPLGIGLPRVDQKRIEEILAHLAGLQVEAINVVPLSADLLIKFSTGVVWSSLSKYAEPDPDLPTWELTMPGRMFIQMFGDPIPTWSWLLSDVP